MVRDSHEKAYEHLRTTLDNVISLLYDSYIFCYYRLVKNDKKKVSKIDSERR